MGLRRAIGLLAACLTLAGSAPGYYHFVHYSSTSGPYVPILEKFDLNALPGRTVQYLISSEGPTQYAPGDSFAAVISQVRLAARAWNEVPGSELRIAYGGIAMPGTVQNTPAIDVVFDELPPGLVALGGPVSRAGVVVLEDGGSFVPITRAVVTLGRDLRERPSFSERFFLSVVHEFGHALGLQHTLTSSVMATEITRATTKASPIAPDDIAGLAVLYSSAAFRAGTGSISGSVLLGGNGVALASVVALSPDGFAVSALTNPDGSYRIKGLAPGRYYVYAHPLPPPMFGEHSPANIVYPRVGDERLTAGPAFELQFYPGGNRPTEALTVEAGKTIESVTFSVQPRVTASPIFGLQTYSFIGSVPTQPAHFFRELGESFVVASGFGMISGAAPVPGLELRVLNGPEALVAPPKPYAPAPEYFLQMDFGLNREASEGYRHLLVSRGQHAHVRPAAFKVVKRQPPVIQSVAPGEEGRGLVITGARLGDDTRIFFDGVPAAELSREEGRIKVRPPRAPKGHQARIVAMNSDGQSSLFVHGPDSPVYSYEGPDGATPAIQVTPAALPAGVETVVVIEGVHTAFAEGETRVGFGTADVFVRRVRVQSPTSIWAEVVVAANAAEAPAHVSVTTGLETIATEGFRILPKSPTQLSLFHLTNAVSGGSSIPAGGTGRVHVRNATFASAAEITVTIRDLQVPVFAASNGEVIFQVPSNFSPGTALVRVKAGSETSLPVMLEIDPPLPVIAAVTDAIGLPIDTIRPARPGDLITLLVYSLTESGSAPDAGRVRIYVNGIQHEVLTIAPALTHAAGHLIRFQLSRDIEAAGAVPLAVAVDSRRSVSVSVPVHPR